MSKFTDRLKLLPPDMVTLYVPVRFDERGRPDYERNALPAIIEALEAADIGHDGGAFCILPEGHRDRCGLCAALSALDALVEQP